MCVLQPVSFIELGSKESPGDFITLEVSGSVCACALVRLSWSHVAETWPLHLLCGRVCVYLKVYLHPEMNLTGERLKVAFATMK